MNDYVLYLLVFVASIVVSFVYEKAIPRFTPIKRMVVKGYVLHHSLYGLFFLLLAAFFWTTDIKISVLMIIAGLGVILEHFLTGGGLDFVTREKKPQN